VGLVTELSDQERTHNLTRVAAMKSAVAGRFALAEISSTLKGSPGAELL
jgi:hypothetical protein